MKKVLLIFILIVIVLIPACHVFGTTNNTFGPSEIYNSGVVDNSIQQTTKNIWATVTVIVQIFAVAAVVFAGLRYMFASSDQKADIKKGLIYLTIGAVLVFAATTIINLVASSAKTVL